jgi:hypothetical protein
MGLVNGSFTTLVPRRAAWQGGGMTRKSHPPGGGIFILIGLFAGIFIGRSYDQISIGALAGLASGVIAAMILWLVTRPR